MCNKDDSEEQQGTREALYRNKLFQEDATSRIMLSADDRHHLVEALACKIRAQNGGAVTLARRGSRRQTAKVAQWVHYGLQCIRCQWVHGKTSSTTEAYAPECSICSSWKVKESIGHAQRHCMHSRMQQPSQIQPSQRLSCVSKTSQWLSFVSRYLNPRVAVALHLPEGQST